MPTKGDNLFDDATTLANDPKLDDLNKSAEKFDEASNQFVIEGRPADAAKALSAEGDEWDKLADEQAQHAFDSSQIEGKYGSSELFLAAAGSSEHAATCKAMAAQWLLAAYTAAPGKGSMHFFQEAVEMYRHAAQLYTAARDRYRHAAKEDEKLGKADENAEAQNELGLAAGADAMHARMMELANKTLQMKHAAEKK